MKTLVIGTGGREHALARALAADPGVDEVHAAPGNPGMAAVADAATTSTRWTATAVAALAERLGVDLVVVGPEAPLVAGVADAVTRRGGSRASARPRAAARLEGSKAFAKEVMAAAGVPTAPCARVHDRRGGRAPRWTSSARRTSSRTTGSPPARASWSPTTGTTALAHARGAASGCVIEEFLDGPEVSLFADHRRRDRLPAAAGPGLQADLRRRRGTQHRRHGRLHAAALGAGRPGRRGAARRCCSRPSTRWPAAARRSPACSTPGWR